MKNFESSSTSPDNLTCSDKSCLENQTLPGLWKFVFLLDGFLLSCCSVTFVEAFFNNFCFFGSEYVERRFFILSKTVFFATTGITKVKKFSVED